MLIAEELVGVFSKYRMTPTAVDAFDTVGKQKMIEKFEVFVKNQQQIQFVMLGFPFKSTNSRDKVIGTMPDEGERLSIATFDSFVKEIESIYKPGARINIASDGFVFNDLLEVKDSTVEQYKEMCLEMAKYNCFQILDLKDFYSLSLNESRLKLIDQFGITEETLQYEVMFNPDVNFLYKGMIRFMTEELAIKSWASGNQHHKAAKALAKKMMFMNEAYSNLVKQEFSDNIRLSMHPSVNNGAKYSFQLIPNAMHSAWHSVVIKQDNFIQTMHKKDAIAQGFQLINNQYYA